MGKRVYIEWNSLYGRHIRFFFWGIESVGIARERPKFVGYSLLTQERVKLLTLNLAGTLIGCIRTKAL